jgi:hypothetical protein
MSVESLKEVIKLWKIGSITAEQCLGKLLLLMLQHDERLAKLETEARRSKQR